MEISKFINKQTLLIAGLVLFGIAWRLTPHMPNFAPVGAIVLALSASLGWRQSLIATLVIMGVSDAIIGFYPGIEWTWLGFGLIIILGVVIKKLSLAWRISLGAISTSSVFFIVSNFGTWISSGMYSFDIAGIIQCYVMALPFFKATLVSDLVFTTLFLASYEIVKFHVYFHFLRRPKLIVPNSSETMVAKMTVSLCTTAK